MARFSSSPSDSRDPVADQPRRSGQLLAEPSEGSQPTGPPLIQGHAQPGIPNWLLAATQQPRIDR